MIENIPCAECGQEFESRYELVQGRKFSVKRCSACLTREEDETKQEAARNARTALENKWSMICPASFRDTDPNHAGLNARAKQLAIAWGERLPKKGLGFVGSTGLGKTRCLFLALKAAHFSGLSCAAVSHTRFSKLSVQMYSGERDAKTEAAGIISSLHHAKVLLLDDIGKPPSTERADSEFEDLISSRTDAGLATIWTANASGQWLIDRFGPDRGAPIVRRLAEFCYVETL